MTRAYMTSRTRSGPTRDPGMIPATGLTSELMAVVDFFPTPRGNRKGDTTRKGINRGFRDPFLTFEIYENYILVNVHITPGCDVWLTDALLSTLWQLVSIVLLDKQTHFHAFFYVSP